MVLLCTFVRGLGIYHMCTNGAPSPSLKKMGFESFPIFAGYAFSLIFTAVGFVFFDSVELQSVIVVRNFSVSERYIICARPLAGLPASFIVVVIAALLEIYRFRSYTSDLLIRRERFTVCFHEYLSYCRNTYTMTIERARQEYHL